MKTHQKVFMVMLLAWGGYMTYGNFSQRSRADSLQVSLDSARNACTRLNDMIPAESRAMWPADATPEERLMFVLDQKQREIDARSGNHFPGGARLSVRFLEMPVAHRSSHANSQRQVSLATQE